MTCEHTSEQLLMYLAGVLSADEESAIEAHLQEGCVACEFHLAEGRRVLDEIPMSLEPRMPRAAARARLLAQLDEMEADEPVPFRLAEAEAPTPRRGRWFVGRVLGGAAAAAALATGVTFMTMDRQVQRQADELASLRGAVEEYDQQLADYSSRAVRMERLAEVAAELYATFRSSPVEMVRMQGVDEYEDTSARFIWDRSRNVGHFVGPEGFRPADGRRLKLWLVAGDDEALSAGTFALDEFGWARFDIGMPEVDFSSFDVAYISYDDADDAHGAEGVEGVGRPRQVLLTGNF